MTHTFTPLIAALADDENNPVSLLDSVYVMILYPRFADVYCVGSYAKFMLYA
jgi:hypothetical protein